MGSFAPLYAGIGARFDGVAGLELGFGERDRQMLEGGVRASISLELRSSDECVVENW